MTYAAAGLAVHGTVSPRATTIESVRIVGMSFLLTARAGSSLGHRPRAERGPQVVQHDLARATIVVEADRALVGARLHLERGLPVPDHHGAPGHVRSPRGGQRPTRVDQIGRASCRERGWGC